MAVQEHKSFKQILVNNEDQRRSACERILKDHGIEHPLSDIRGVYQNILDRPKGTPKKELLAHWQKAQQELSRYIECYRQEPDFSAMSVPELNECLFDACYTSVDNPLFARIGELIRRGADVKACDHYGNPAFRYLVTRFDHSQRDEMGNIVFRLKPVVSEDLLKAFLEAGLDINASCNYDGKCSTFWITLAGVASCNVLRLMLEHGARVNDRDSDGRNALMECRDGRGDAESIRLLLDHGADVDLTTTTGQTAYDIAIENGFLDSAIAIKPNAREDYDNSPAGKKAKHSEAALIAQIKAGYMLEKGDREGYWQLSWDPSADPPSYRLYENDLAGTRTSWFTSDAVVTGRSGSGASLRIDTSRDPAKEAEQEAKKRVMRNSAILPARLGQYQILCSFALPLLRCEEDFKRLMNALDALHAHKFGYSDRQIAMQAMIPQVFEIACRHVHSLDDLLLLCCKTPEIIERLPEDSEDSPVGRLYHYDLAALKARGLLTLNMPEFVGAEPIKIGGKKIELP